ncbi:hypothetical protein Tsubulata_034493 [Turnera subulata]|uniref:CCHC-type domain-containing protein n=1 Tax=Turnera subulata TaxID=218843 RepID=A0A9Q0FN78_9ROSI|nr:hypothetical protein Tsubulata_034493 [Turnera subulata]
MLMVMVMWIEEEETEYEEGDIVVHEKHGVTVVELSEAVKARMNKPWSQAVVVKLLGRQIGYTILKEKIESLWKPVGAFKIVDLANNFFIVRFKEEVDFHRAPFGGPWTIFNHVLSVQVWSPKFRASKGTIDTAIVWVQFPDIPHNWYHSKLLKTLGDLVGRTMKVDINTSTSSRGKFAKVAVAVDLTKPLKGRIRLEGETIKVIYEGLPNVCYSCGRVSHITAACPVTKQAERAVSGGGHEEEQALHTVVSSDKQPKRVVVQEANNEWGEWTTITSRVRRGSRSFLERGRERWEPYSSMYYRRSSEKLLT